MVPLESIHSDDGSEPVDGREDLLEEVVGVVDSERRVSDQLHGRSDQADQRQARTSIHHHVRHSLTPQRLPSTVLCQLLSVEF